MPQIFLITWVTHNSRISERMRLYEEVIIAHRTEKPDLGNEIPVEFSSDEEAEIAVYLIEIIQKDKLQILAMNICQDHVHMIIVCDFEELSRVVQKLKGGSSYKYQKMRRDRHGVLTP